MSALEARGIAVQKGGRAIVDGVDLVANAGEVVGLIGPNGAGKTTLLRALCRLEILAAGEVSVGGVPLEVLNRRDLARAVSYCAQGAVCHWPLRVARLVALGRLPHLDPWRRAGAVDAAAIDRALAETDVGELADRAVDTLSSGERARVLLARALAVEAAVLLADEPVAALDPRHQLQIMATLRRRSRAGAAVICVLHDLSLAARFCDRVALLHEGRLHATGTPTEVLAPENLAATFAVRAAFGNFEGEPYLVPWDSGQPGEMWS